MRVRSPCLNLPPSRTTRASQTLGLGLPGANSGYSPRPGRPLGKQSRWESTLPREGAPCAPYLQASSLPPPPHLPAQPRSAPGPLLPAPLPLPWVQSWGALSMIAQPVARILICIPRRPALPGHQPTFGPDTGRPTPAPGRRLRAVVEPFFPKHLGNAACLRGGSPGRPPKKGT